MEILVVLFTSGLTIEEVYAKFEQRAEKFRRVNGLLQKYYVHAKSTGEVGAIYIFDTKQSLEAFRSSDLPKDTREAYKVLEDPSIRELEVIHTLYDRP